MYVEGEDRTAERLRFLGKPANPKTIQRPLILYLNLFLFWWEIFIKVGLLGSISGELVGYTYRANSFVANFIDISGGSLLSSMRLVIEDKDLWK